MIHKFIETQGNKEGIACEGGEGVPEVAATRDRDDYRTVSCGSAVCLAGLHLTEVPGKGEGGADLQPAFLAWESHFPEEGELFLCAYVPPVCQAHPEWVPVLSHTQVQY